MPGTRSVSPPGIWRRVLERISSWVADEAQPVPPGLRTCEFDCDEPDCSAERWTSCEQRLGRQRRLAEPLARIRARG